MAIVHFLNVKEGDCSVIQHNSGRVTVIDVCNAKSTDEVAQEAIEKALTMLASLDEGVGGNFQQRNYPVNPVSYLREHGVESIFRYVQTHPDMDHMDGIKALFEAFSPLNLWDTDNRKEMPTETWEGSPYNDQDWRFYKRLRDSGSNDGPRRLTLFSGAQGQFWNVGQERSSRGDGLYVLVPTEELVDLANERDDHNLCSYVILYRSGGNRIVFAGDSHDEAWDHILAKHEQDVGNIDLLIAPHHGRKSGRSYRFLDVLCPRLTFFGNAPSEHLAYGAWQQRGLSFVTNNQANCMVVHVGRDLMILYVTHENYARRVNPATFFAETFKAWYVGPVGPIGAGQLPGRSSAPG